MSEPRRFQGGVELVDILRRLVAEGHTDTEIAEVVGQVTHQPPPSKQAVAYWRKKYDIRRERHRAKSGDHSWVRPWRVNMRHVGDGIEHRLYDFSRRRAGVRLSSDAERRLDEFLETLDRNGLVIDYNPRTPDGWLTRRRDPSLDDPENIIRKPSGRQGT